MELLMLLITAHFIADFYAQPSSWVTCRNSRHIKSKGLWKHVGVHTLFYCLVFAISPVTFTDALIGISIIVATHLAADVLKSYLPHTLLYFLLDQALHLLVIIFTWAWLIEVGFSDISTFIQAQITTSNLIIAMAYVLACKPASVIIALALKKHTDNLTTDSNTQNAGLISAGSWIGYIERCLAISFIFMGQFAGIGFLVATKTIFRFGDLTSNKDMKLTEYMMLGTLLSYAIALFIGWNAHWLYQIT